MPKEIADEIKDNLGSYLNKNRQFEMSGPLQKYKPTDQQINTAKETVKANKIKEYVQKEKIQPTPEMIKKFTNDASDEIIYF